MARRIADVTLALDVAVGPDPTDLRALPRPEANWIAALDDPHVPVRIAYSPTLGYATVDAEVAAACERAVEVLDSLGADVVVVDSVFDDDPVGDFLTLDWGRHAAHPAALHGSSRAGRRSIPSCVTSSTWRSRRRRSRSSRSSTTSTS